MPSSPSLAAALFFAFLTLNAACAQSKAICPPPDGVALQVLGSGGPIADDGRASAAYIIWANGQSRVMIDVGGGSFLRFGEAGARFNDLEFVGLSHFHTDHSADFPALLKSGYFSTRERSLTVAGPDADGPFPGLRQYLVALLSSDSGAYGYLSGYLDGSGGLARLDVQEVPGSNGGAQMLFESADRNIRVDAMHVPHGIVPALGFRVRVGGAVFVFASDQNGSDPKFAEFARDADVLVMHMPIPEGATGGAVQLHAPPSVIGEVAAAAKADTLVLSHFMARSLRNFDDNVAAVESAYKGRTVVAADLQCVWIM